MRKLTGYIEGKMPITFRFLLGGVPSQSPKSPTQHLYKHLPDLQEYQLGGVRRLSSIVADRSWLSVVQATRLRMSVLPERERNFLFLWRELSRHRANLLCLLPLVLVGKESWCERNISQVRSSLLGPQVFPLFVILVASFLTNALASLNERQAQSPISPRS